MNKGMPIGASIFAMLLATVTATFAMNAAAGKQDHCAAAAAVGKNGISSTQLADGSWLFLGGKDRSGNVVGSAQVCKPGSANPVLLGAVLNNARADQSATLLSDGSVLIIGGVNANGRTLTTAERFDPDANKFRQIDQRFSARSKHSATLLADGRVLIAGGVDGKGNALVDAELIDSDTFATTPLESSLGEPRSEHHAMLQESGNVVISGGIGSDSQTLVVAEQFDTQSSQFSTGANSEESNAAPTVASTWPAADSKIDVATRFALLFSTPLQPQTLNQKTVTLLGPGGPVDIQVVAAEAGRVLFVTPKASLQPGASYTLFVNGASDNRDQTLPFFAAAFTTLSVTAESQTDNGASSPNTTNGAPSGSSAAHAALSAQQRHFLFGGNTALVDGDQSNVMTAEQLARKAWDSVDDELWIPGPQNYHGEWISGRAQVAQQSQPAWARWQKIGTTASWSQNYKLPRAEFGTGVTAIQGQVLRLNGLPLAGVTLSIGNRRTLTNSNGEFWLDNVKAGMQVLVIDGASANHSGKAYGRYEYQLEVAAGSTNTLDFPIWLTRLDMAHSFRIDSPTREDIDVTNPLMPGLALHIPKGTVIRDANNKIVTQVSLTPVPADQTPFPMPYNEVPVYYTLQPGGATLSGTDGSTRFATVTYPNYTTQPAGARFTLFGYNPRHLGWYNYSVAAVSADGKRLESEDEFGIYEFTAFSAAASGGQQAPKNPKECGGKGGDPVTCYDGIFIESSTDLSVSDIMPLEVTRVYRTMDANQRSFGVGANHNYDWYLSLVNQHVGATEYEVDAFILVQASGEGIQFDPVGAKTFKIPGTEFVSHMPGSFYGAKLTMTTENGEKGFTVATRSGMKYRFAYYGALLKWIEDRKGNRIVISRGGNSRVSSVTSPGNRKYINFSYDVAGCTSCISQLVDNAGRAVNYQYDSTGHLLTVTSPTGAVTTYTYGANPGDPSDTINLHNMTSVTDARGNIKVRNAFYVYAPPPPDGQPASLYIPVFGDPERARSFADAVLSWLIPPVNAQIVPPIHNEGTSDLNLVGRVAHQLYADNTTNSFTYGINASGVMSNMFLTNELGQRRRLTYDTDGNILTETLAVGTSQAQTWTHVWDPVSKLKTRTTDPLGRVTEWQYDTKGNTTRVTRAVGTAEENVWNYSYTTTNRISTVTDPANHVTQYVYDANDDLVQIVDALSNSVNLTWNSVGQIATVTRQSGSLALTTSYQYMEGDLASITDAQGNVSSQFVDSLGRIVSTVDPLGNQRLYEYDAADRVVRVTEPMGNDQLMAYDANGNMTSFTDSRGNITTFGYDARNRVSSKADATNLLETYTYDARGNLKQVDKRSGKRVTYFYDAMNRPTVVSFFAASNLTTPASTITNTWDAGDRLTQSTDSAAGTITRTYNTLDQVLSEISPQGQINNVYNTLGLRTRLTVAGQTPVDYEYDAINRLTKIKEGSSDVVTYQYTGWRLMGMTQPNNVVAAYGYDTNDQLTSILYTQGSTTLGNFTYSYDTTGQRTSVGGSLADSLLPTAATTNSYNTNNRLTNWNGATLSSNVDGQMLGDGTYQYQWDERGRLSGITQGGSTVATFQYDAFGRRVGKTVSGVNTNFLHDGWQIVQEKNGAAIKANVLAGPGLDRVLRRVEGGQTATFLTDALGSSVALVGSSGIATSYKFGPYGVTSTTGAASNNAYQYTGRENDGPLYYYRNRYYHPQFGRFVSEDPLGLGAGQNVYAYVEGNPIGFIDSLGLAPKGNGGPQSRGAPVVGVFGCMIGCIESAWGDKEPQASLQPVVGGGIEICDPRKPPPSEPQACPKENPKKDCGMYDPNCDNQPQMPGLGKDLKGGLGLGVSVEHDGRVCVQIGLFGGVPLPSVDLGGISE